MTTAVHPTAILDDSVELGEGVVIEPYVVIGADVLIGDRCEIGAHAQVRGPTTMGRENIVRGHACLGFDPQDLTYKGERTTLVIGSGNDFREFSTVNRGTVKGSGTTSIGDQNLFMATTHVGHDCRVGSHTVFANAGTLAGHVDVGDWAVVGAFSAVQQFCRVGDHAYIGGFSVITMDVLPYSITVGQKPQCYGVNRIGLERRGFSKETIRAVELTLKTLTRSKLNTSQALDLIRKQETGLPEISALVDFVASSKAGVIKARRRGSRGGGETL